MASIARRSRSDSPCGCALPASTSTCRVPARSHAHSLRSRRRPDRSSTGLRASASPTGTAISRCSTASSPPRSTAWALTLIRTAGGRRTLRPTKGPDDRFAPLPRGRDDIEDGAGLAVGDPATDQPGRSEDTTSSLTVPGTVAEQSRRRSRRLPFEALSAARARATRCLARDGVHELAGSSHPPARAARGRPLYRSARHHGALATQRMGDPAHRAQRARVPAPPRRHAVRRQPVDAGVRNGVPAPDARRRAARRRRGLRVRHVSDPADAGARASLGRGGDRAGDRDRRRPLRRHPHRDRISTRCCGRATAASCAERSS